MDVSYESPVATVTGISESSVIVVNMNETSVIIVNTIGRESGDYSRCERVRVQ